nr:3-phosphoshikimate 1-carboxyvinyltransferase [Propionibacterium sp.]
MTGWVAPTPSGPVTGTVRVPGSKSATARALVLAALADGESVLTGVLDARDSALMRAALRGLGVDLVDEGPGVVRVRPPARYTPARIDVGLSGTVMRFLPPVAALASGRSDFFGDAAASARPVAPLLDALRQAGVRIEGDALPFSVLGTGRVPGGPVELDASGSSQFVSALLMSGARFDAGVTVRHVGPPIPSRPYLGMTAGMLRDRGVRIDTPDADTWVVHPGPLAARDEAIEPDLMNAAAFLCAGLVTGGRVEMAWPERTLQDADGVLAALAAFGARVERTPGHVAVSGAGVRGADVDLRDVSELTCVLAAVACLADGPSRLRGVGHIRGHETDRLAALAAELGARGARVSETSDGLAITPGPLRGGPFATYADHRMAHAAAVLGLAVPGVELDDVACTSKTMPDFPGLWTALVGR